MSDVVPLKITWLLHMLSVAVHVHNARASCSLWITARLRIYFVLTKRLDFKLQRAPQYGRFTLFVSTFILTPYYNIFRNASSQFGIYLSEIVLLYQFFSTFFNCSILSTSFATTGIRYKAISQRRFTCHQMSINMIKKNFQDKKN